MDFDASGVVGDRAYGVLNRESGTILSAKREGRLLEAAAEYRSGVLVVTLPSGEEFRQGTRLDERTLVVARVSRGAGRSPRRSAWRRSRVPKTLNETIRRWSPGRERRGRFVDESALHLLTSSELEGLSRERPELTWDVRRFRPNIFVDDEEASIDTSPRRNIQVGEVVIEITKPCSRCVMTTRLSREVSIVNSTCCAT